MARKLNPEDVAAKRRTPEHEETDTLVEQESWLQKIGQQRDAILKMSPELSAWFGEQFTSQAHL